MTMSTMTASSNTLASSKDICIICLGSFGVQSRRVPLQCQNEKCKRNYCARCLETIKTYDGSDRPFRCMYCLVEYPLGTAPKKNKLLMQQLWSRVNTKYGFVLHNDTVPAGMSKENLQFEMECRRYHLQHMMDVFVRFPDRNRFTNALIARNDAHDLLDQLTKILDRIRHNTVANDSSGQKEYEKVITLPGQSIGSFYVDLCERLNAEIDDAELRCMFPAIFAKSIEWDCTRGSGDEFQPKFPELVAALQQDIFTLLRRSHHAALRAKIGFIGYTSAGKTTLMCRLLGKARPEPNEFFPVRTTKSTYYPLQYDRADLLTNPDDSQTSTAVTFVDIQGNDIGNNISSGNFAVGNYMDEIRKADCDIYVIVFSGKLDHDQHRWIEFIEQNMIRRCVLVQSKMDELFLAKFLEKSGVCYGMSSTEQRNTLKQSTIADLRRDLAVKGRRVYLTAANYYPTSTDAMVLLQNEGAQTFDFQELLDELGRLAPSARHLRVQTLAIRSVARVINSCFRCGYVLNVMKYKIAAGIAAVVPFGDSLPRYLARDNVKQAFGINKDFLQGLRQYQITVFKNVLQSSVFDEYVQLVMHKGTDDVHLKELLSEAGLGLATLGGSLIDDAIRGATPVLSGLSKGASVAIGVATVGAGIVLSAAVCAWSAVKAKKHIFSFINQLCDDLIIISSALIVSMLQEQNE